MFFSYTLDCFRHCCMMLRASHTTRGLVVVQPSIHPLSTITQECISPCRKHSAEPLKAGSRAWLFILFCKLLAHLFPSSSVSTRIFPPWLWSCAFEPAWLSSLGSRAQTDSAGMVSTFRCEVPFCIASHDDHVLFLMRT